jgi:two-component system, chemotaxis family, response regulator PixG
MADGQCKLGGFLGKPLILAIRHSMTIGSFWLQDEITTMNQGNIVQLLKAAADRPSGELQISRNGVTWQIGRSGTQIHYAYHSGQPAVLVEQFLPILGLEGTVSSYREIIQSQPELRLIDAIAQLRDRYILTPDQTQQLLRAIAEDALECLLWVDQIDAHWPEPGINPASLQAIGCDREALIQHLESRLPAWKRLEPAITTPHQRPRCDDFGRLHQSVPQGILPVQTLEIMARLMQGISLRQIAFLLKQDVLKLCQMLHPYISAGVLRLEPPTHPDHLLPTIPASYTAIPRETASYAINRDTSSYNINRNTASYAIPQPKPAPRYKVVCIDDSPTVLDMIQRYLGTEKFEVATVENPMASLSALFDMKPDLILMDVSMPGIDGNRLCQILKRSSVFTHVPIVMVSGNTGLLDKEKAKAAGATDYLTKPFSQEELLALVNQYLTQTPAYAQ